MEDMQQRHVWNYFLRNKIWKNYYLQEALAFLVKT